MMQALSRILIELYEAAEHVSIKNYPQEALRLIRPLIHFDGAVFGMGEISANGTTGLSIEQAYVHQRDASILAEYAQVSAEDPVTRRFAQGLERPLICNCGAFYRDNKLPALAEFSKRHEISQLLLYGMPPASLKTARWLVLYRGNDDQFSKREEEYLMAIWPHVVRGLMLNRSACLDRQVETQEGRAAALLDHLGRIEVADPCFRKLLAMEWQGYSGNRIPEQVLQSWRSGVGYTGTHIHISMSVQQEYIVCHATKKSGWHVLTKMERAVAGQFAIGASYKDIANNLSVSQNTVRSHIKHIYDKLDLHDKAELANLLAKK